MPPPANQVSRAGPRSLRHRVVTAEGSVRVINDDSQHASTSTRQDTGSIRGLVRPTTRQVTARPRTTQRSIAGTQASNSRATQVWTPQPGVSQVQATRRPATRSQTYGQRATTNGRPQGASAANRPQGAQLAIVRSQTARVPAARSQTVRAPVTRSRAQARATRLSAVPEASVPAQTQTQPRADESAVLPLERQPASPLHSTPSNVIHPAPDDSAEFVPLTTSTPPGAVAASQAWSQPHALAIPSTPTPTQALTQVAPFSKSPIVVESDHSGSFLLTTAEQQRGQGSTSRAAAIGEHAIPPMFMNQSYDASPVWMRQRQTQQTLSTAMTSLTRREDGGSVQDTDPFAAPLGSVEQTLSDSRNLVAIKLSKSKRKGKGKAKSSLGSGTRVQSKTSAKAPKRSLDEDGPKFVWRVDSIAHDLTRMADGDLNSLERQSDPMGSRKDVTDWVEKMQFLYGEGTKDYRTMYNWVESDWSDFSRRI